MTIRSFRNLPCVALALASTYLQPLLANAQTASAPITIAPFAPPAGTSYVIQPSSETPLTAAAKLKLIQQKVKYVFVLFQENRAYDFYFASYPGAEGLYQHADGTANVNPPGYTQPFVTSTGTVTTIHPFKIPTAVTDVNGHSVPLYPNSLYSTDHSHAGMNAGIDYKNGAVMNDGYALDNEGVTLSPTNVPSKTPSLAAEQEGEVALSHIDCDVAGFLWTYADKFTLFDNFHQTIIGPSTPNAIAMIAGQSGETQWVEHPNLSSLTLTGNMSLPVVADPDPYWGSAIDPTPAASKLPEVSNTTTPASNLTFATLPLSFMGTSINSITAQDTNPAFDLIDVQADIEKIAGHRQAAINWGWYQEGFNANDYPPNSPGVPGAGPNTANGAPGGDYIAHHNAPQYFGYVGNNPAEKAHLHGLADFFTALSSQTLPSTGGVFYARGGYNNIAGLKPYFGTGTLAAQTLGEQVTYAGNDDHPGYSDSQVSEALLAQEINAIAASPYWSESAIVISYDETDGEYDHGAINNRELDPEGQPLAQGPRIPTIVISPYGVSHGVSHVSSEHGSIIRFIDEVFNLIPLADLPNEYAARQQGLAMFGQANLGPSDDFDGLGDLTEAFDNNRLLGSAAPIPASYATISDVVTLPHYNNQGCSVLGITTTDVLQGVTNPIPADFNPRPSTAPGTPTLGTWVP